MRRRLAAVGATLLAVATTLTLAPVGAQAAPVGPGPAPDAAAAPPASDIREVKPDATYPLLGEKTPQAPVATTAATRSRQLRAAAVATPPVGTVRQWLALDDYNGFVYRKDYTLRAVGEHIEVWVANDLAFPVGDCRVATPGTTDITDAQVQALVAEFDTTMFPKESAAFSVAPSRDGTNAALGPDANGDGGDYTGSGDKIVTLVDNVRDDNFYDFPARPAYIAGFFSDFFNFLLDRNVMTIDAFDWTHRTGANPPNEPTADLCSSRPARPRLYEGTFAHEYQHLLQSYTDPFETTWLNEGLSDFAISLTGYADTTATVFQPRAESHLFCFQGYGPVPTPSNTNPRDCGGPANSLTLWGDQGDGSEILADYGNAWSFMLYLFDRYGLPFMSALHQDGARQGLASVAAQLDAVGTGKTLARTLHDYQTMVLLDARLDGRRGTVVGANRRDLVTPSLTSSVNLENPSSFAAPGAAPNGADYVVLRDARQRGAGRDELRQVSFSGAATLPPQPLLWTTVSNDPDRPGDAVLWSGNQSNLDASAIIPVTVPADDPTLRFVAKYGAEAGYDYGYVVVSTDGGTSYTALAGDATEPGPLGPALNGTTAGFEPRSYDLSAYAGQRVLLGFRYVSDGGVNEGGLLVDDVTVGATTVSDGTNLADFRSTTQIVPTAVPNWNVRLVAYRDEEPVASYLEVDGRFSFSLGKRELERLKSYDKVVAIVSFDDPSEQIQQSATYSLTANGRTLPGGS